MRKSPKFKILIHDPEDQIDSHLQQSKFNQNFPQQIKQPPPLQNNKIQFVKHSKYIWSKPQDFLINNSITIPDQSNTIHHEYTSHKHDNFQNSRIKIQTPSIMTQKKKDLERIKSQNYNSRRLVIQQADKIERAVENNKFLNQKNKISKRSPIIYPNKLPKIISSKKQQISGSPKKLYTMGIYEQFENEVLIQDQSIDNSIIFGEMSKNMEKITLQYDEFSIKEEYQKIPKQLFERKEQNIRNFAYRCSKINPVFCKLEYLTVVQLIKNSHVISLDKDQILYNKKYIFNSSYIILWGVFSIFNSNNQLIKNAGIGQILGEQYFLEGLNNYHNRFRNEKAITQTISGVLELTRMTIKQLKTQLYRLSIKKDLEMLELIFKKQYFNKKSKLNNLKLQKNDNFQS